MLVSPPLISIIIPVFNAENFLETTIKSIVDQSYNNWELILINDGSSDRSGEICKASVMNDDRIHYYEKQNGGVSSARNEGISHAKGQYITFVDADDYVAKSYCEQLLDKMRPEIGMVVFGLGYTHFDGHVERVSHRLTDGTYSYSEFTKMIIDDGTLSGFSIHSACAVLYRKNVIEQYGLCFDSDVKYNEDGLFNVEYFLHSKQAIEICYQEVIYYYRINNSSASRSVDRQGSIYRNSMKKVEEKLLQLETQFTSAEITQQIYNRRAMLLLDCLIYLSRNGMLTIKKTATLFDENTDIFSNCKLCLKKMGFGKCLVGVAFVKRIILLAYFVVRIRFRRI